MERFVCVPEAGPERVRKLRALPAEHGPSARSRGSEGGSEVWSSSGFPEGKRRRCVGSAVGIALRSVECAGFPANAGGTAEAASFVPRSGEEGRFLMPRGLASGERTADCRPYGRSIL